MSFIRLLWTEADGQWRPDKRSCFNERYYNGSEPSPFVRLDGDPGTVIWDLAFANRAPTAEQAGQVTRVVLWDGACWVELRDGLVGFGWSPYPHRGDASVFVAMHALEQFSTKIIDHPEQVQLTMRASVATRGTVLPEPLQHADSTVSICMIFGHEYDPALGALCALVEEACERRLAEPDPPMAAGTVAPASRDGMPHHANAHEKPFPSAAAGESPRSRVASPGAAHASDDGLGMDNSPAGKPARPSEHILEITVDAIPDTAGWLSFADVTCQELLAPAQMSADAHESFVPAPLHGHHGRHRVGDW